MVYYPQCHIAYNSKFQMQGLSAFPKLPGFTPGHDPTVKFI